MYCTIYFYTLFSFTQRIVLVVLLSASILLFHVQDYGFDSYTGITDCTYSLQHKPSYFATLSDQSLSRLLQLSLSLSYAPCEMDVATPTTKSVISRLLHCYI